MKKNFNHVLTIIAVLFGSHQLNAQTYNYVPDSTFDGNGLKSFIFFNNIDRMYGCDLQADEKVVMAGISKNPSSGSYQLCAVRLDTDGAFDITFSGDGIEFISMGALNSVNGLTPKIKVASNGKITVSRFFSRAVRYQIARFCEWDEEKADEYQYHVSARSLTHAKEQGLKAEQLLSLLVKYTNGNVPPALVKALKQWDAHGTEARVEKLLVLRVNRPEILEEMRKSKASKFLGEILSPTAVIIKSGAESKVLAALTELGLLSEIET